jgi:hypothetical protein
LIRYLGLVANSDAQSVCEFEEREASALSRSGSFASNQKLAEKCEDWFCGRLDLVSIGVSRHRSVCRERRVNPQFATDEPSAKEIDFENMRGKSYCEFWFYNADGRVAYFNTSGLGNSPDPKATCPSNLRDHIKTRELAKQVGVKAVFGVGSRAWMFDTAVLTVSTVIETCDGLQARWWGNFRIPKGVDKP